MLQTDASRSTPVALTVRPVNAGSALAGNRLSRRTPWITLAASLVGAFALFALLAAASGSEFSVVGAILVGAIAYVLVISLLSGFVEGRRQAVDRCITALVTGAFLLAMVPLISVGITVVSNGIARFDMEFFSSSMRNVTGEGGGALHAMVGTLMITLAATIISVPLGLMTSIYLVEYGRGRLAKLITFLVDVMTGIPSIVAGLFAFALFAVFFGPGVRMGIVGAVALSVLMIPVVVRSSEEMLRLVPNELREASYALGVPKWRTILKIVLPTSIAGITTGIMLSIARVIGETAPLLITAGFTASMNYNLFSDRMQSLPVYVYTQFANQGNPAFAFLERAWAAALLLILIVMALNLFARLIAKWFSPKFGR
ncbi:phosphate ABC transporter permease PstA [Leucobacter chromiireducens]|uniref:Phosphate transport system permease protein PstA n=1 Tax=Leucobacter chromiireducens subsp. solipictus TaxID=398235 RepID=A0ABS1SE07_9MICO|nr:phosphate ABC transporter permease PstA [Leucobacter chromiireducens]MBL3678774.1 phosphate ABC transporter permease PstA [Leucobacter chromiireducens subsp. solipictus]